MLWFTYLYVPKRKPAQTGIVSLYFPSACRVSSDLYYYRFSPPFFFNLIQSKFLSKNNFLPALLVLCSLPLLAAALEMSWTFLLVYYILGRKMSPAWNSGAKMWIWPLDFKSSVEISSWHWYHHRWAPPRTRSRIGPSGSPSCPPAFIQYCWWKKKTKTTTAPLAPTLAPYHTFGLPQWQKLSLLNAPIKIKS